MYSDYFCMNHIRIVVINKRLLQYVHRSRNLQEHLMCPFKSPIDFGKCLLYVECEKMTNF